MIAELSGLSLTDGCNLLFLNGKILPAPGDLTDPFMSMHAKTNDGLLHNVGLDPGIVGILGLDPASLPLEENLVYKGNDFARASAAVSSISEPRTFEPQSDYPTPFIEIRRARLKYSEIGLTFNNVETRMRTPRRVNYYSLAIPLSGSQLVATGSGAITTRPPFARLSSAGSVYDIQRSANYVAIVASLSVAGFEHFVGDKIDFLIPPEKSFSFMLDLSRNQFGVFASTLGTLCKALGERGNETPQRDIVISRLEEALWFAFADACPELYREYEAAQRVSTVSAVARRVTSYIDDHAERELTLSDLVVVSGVSARTLYSRFSESYGIGPMAYLKRVKLRRCREDLLCAAPDTEFVGDIAARWGFYHLSSFARDYRRHFGELPSETLRRDR
jgi:AraC-like DNA-binding protein